MEFKFQSIESTDEEKSRQKNFTAAAMQIKREIKTF